MICRHIAVQCASDGLFCDGTERCEPALGCVHSGNPCGEGGLGCSEALDTCLDHYSLIGPTIGSGVARSTGQAPPGVARYSLWSTVGEVGAGATQLNNAPYINDILSDVREGGGSTSLFQESSEGVRTKLYQNMTKAYGRPWQPDSGQTPSLDGQCGIDGKCETGPLAGSECEKRSDCQGDPAELLRAMTDAGPLVLGSGFWAVEHASAANASEEYPTHEVERSTLLKELWSFEMLLGNEAYADAMDPTIGDPDLEGLGGLHAFKSDAQPGFTLLEEELALLRGRRIQLPGGDAPFQDTTSHGGTYPDYSGSRAAVYNRLPHNAVGSVAYSCTYGICDDDPITPELTSNDEAALEFPQGHGDAYGYYLKAEKVYLEAFMGNPIFDPPLADACPNGSALVAQRLIDSQSGDIELVEPDDGEPVPVRFQAVRNFALAAVARARTATRVVDLTFRRDYQENVEQQRLIDSDADQAWGTLDWARRGAMASYLNWAVASQLLPPREDAECVSGRCEDGACDGGPAPGRTCLDSTECVCDPLGQVDRFTTDALGELAGSVAMMQERVDAAGAGLNPMGLVPNVVPFGIQVTESDVGVSHFAQVRDQAIKAIASAHNVLSWANRLGLRLRGNDGNFSKFAEHAEDQEADFNNRLIEIFGYPALSDPADNDANPDNDDVEHTTSPDLVNFLLSDQQLKDFGYGTRAAPGEIQIAMSELRAAELRGDEADLALADLEGQILDQMQRIELITETVAAEMSINASACDQQLKLLDRLEEIKNRCDFWCGFKKGLGAVAILAASATACASTGAGCGLLLANGGLAGAVTYAGIASTQLLAVGNAIDNEGASQIRDTFDVQREQQRVECWQTAEITGIRNRERLGNADIDLAALFRRTPQYMVNLAIEAEGVRQAMGRLNAAVQRGYRLVQERERIRKQLRDRVLDHRWRDMAFRIFRNNALQQYGAFFDMAARWVVLAAKAHAYEFNDLDTVADELEDIHKMRSLGGCEFGPVGFNGVDGLCGILDRLDRADFLNAPQGYAGKHSFSFKKHMLGLGVHGSPTSRTFVVDPGTDLFTAPQHGFVTRDAVVVASNIRDGLPAPLIEASEYYVRTLDSDTFVLHRTPNGAELNSPGTQLLIADFGTGTTHTIALSPNRQFRAWVESHIVQHLEDHPVMRDLADLHLDSPYRDEGPAIVIPFRTEGWDRNLFGNGANERFGNLNFDASENVKIKYYWLRFEGLFQGGFDSEFAVYLFPYGDSVFKVGRNLSVEFRSWYVVDQWLEYPDQVIDDNDFGDLTRTYSAWRETGKRSNGFLNTLKRFTEAKARIELVEPLEREKGRRADLAGRSIWNTNWLLVIPSGAFENTTRDPAIRRRVLLERIYGPTGNPLQNAGISDIVWTIEGYKSGN